MGADRHGTLPTLAIASLVPNLPQLFQHFAAVPNESTCR
jgi:hypothetical protein